MALTKVQIIKCLIKNALKGDDEYARFTTTYMKNRINWFIGGEDITASRVLAACKELVKEGYLKLEGDGFHYVFKKIRQKGEV